MLQRSQLGLQGGAAPCTLRVKLPPVLLGQQASQGVGTPQLGARDPPKAATWRLARVDQAVQGPLVHCLQQRERSVENGFAAGRLTD